VPKKAPKDKPTPKPDHLKPVDVNEGLFFRHIKSNNRYMVVHLAVCADNGAREGKDYVVYKSVSLFGVDGDTFVRNLDEFCKKFTWP